MITTNDVLRKQRIQTAFLGLLAAFEQENLQLEGVRFVVKDPNRIGQTKLFDVPVEVDFR